MLKLGKESPTSMMEETFAMQGGEGDGSYANNSEIQNYALHVLAKNDMAHLFEAHWKAHLPHHANARRPIISIADFGCTHGRNTVEYASSIVKMLRDMHEDGEVPQIHYYFNDLPSNDFNGLFKVLAQQKETLMMDEEKKLCFVAGVPGSFYGRLFPDNTLHLGVSALSLHWLSQIPPPLLDKASPSWNGGHIWISPHKPAVAEAYAEQFKKDLTRFLRCRAKELIPNGGLLYLMLRGRPDNIPAHDLSSDWDDMEHAWETMISQNLVDGRLRDTFNVPMYFPCILEFEEALKDIPEFHVLELKLVKGVPILPTKKMDLLKSDPNALARFMSGLFKSTLNSLFEAHIGEDASIAFFHKHEQRVQEIAHNERTWDYDILCALLST